jgi:hypothetical protein
MAAGTVVEAVAAGDVRVVEAAGAGDAIVAVTVVAGDTAAIGSFSSYILI